jgi:O-antigen ligase
MTKALPSAGRYVNSGLVLGIVAVVLPPLAVIFPLALAPLQGIAALAVLLADFRRVRAGIAALAPLAGLFAALAAWATASALWSILPEHSLLEGLRFFAISAAGLILLGAAAQLTSHESRRLGRLLAAGVAAAALLIGVEWLEGGVLYKLLHPARAAQPFYMTRLDRGAVTLVLALFPALIGLRRKIGPAVALAIVAGVAVYLVPSQAALLALFAGFIVFALAWRLPRFIATALGIALMAATVALPVAIPSQNGIVALQHNAPWIKYSGIHRLLIWRFTSDRIAERPLLGWGMDASRGLPGGQVDLATAVPGIHLAPYSVALPLHPHDAALQWRVELGIPGTLLALAIVLWGLWRVGWARHLSPGRRAAMLGWAAAALIVASLGYGIWQAWWLACLWFTVALQAGSARDDS